MKKLIITIMTVLIPSCMALAQDVDLDKAVALCKQHRHSNPNKVSHQGIRDQIDDPGWEHCTELLELKAQHDMAAFTARNSEIAITKRALEQLKSKQ